MARFNLFKKKEEKEASPCCCSTEPKKEETACCCNSAPKAEKNTSCCCGKTVEGICCIKVLGAGCKSCHEQYEYAKEAAENLGLECKVEYITDMEIIMSYGVMSMPAIVINDQVVSFGRVLKVKDVEKLLESDYK